MTWILEGAAVFCLVYYGIVVLYSGMTTSFALFWPVFALFLGLLSGAVHFHHRHPSEIPVWASVAVTTVVSAMAVVFVIVELLIGWGAVSSTKQAMDYVIVLGANVNGREIGKSLKKRLNKALEYAETNPNTVLILSGGQGKGEDITEAQAMYDYLVFNGVEKDQLLMENQSTSTLENIAYSREVIKRHERWKAMMMRKNLDEDYKENEEDNEKDDRGQTLGRDDLRIGILTSNFHIYRARQIAKKQGFTHVQGIPASTDPVLFLHLWVRECFAVLKDKFVGNF